MRRNSHLQRRSETCFWLLCTFQTTADPLPLPCRGAVADLRTHNSAGPQDLEPVWHMRRHFIITFRKKKKSTKQEKEETSSCLTSAHLSHQEREALCCKIADVLLLVFQQRAVQTTQRKKLFISTIIDKQIHLEKLPLILFLTCRCCSCPSPWASTGTCRGRRDRWKPTPAPPCLWSPAARWSEWRSQGSVGRSRSAGLWRAAPRGWKKEKRSCWLETTN